jgi:hypothetical protein
MTVPDMLAEFSLRRLTFIGRHMTTERQMIEVPAGQLSAELHRRGFNDDEPIRVTIEPEQELFPGRRESRKLVIAAGLTDEDIDRLIEQARGEAALRLE